MFAFPSPARNPLHKAVVAVAARVVKATTTLSKAIPQLRRGSLALVALGALAACEPVDTGLLGIL